MAMIKEVVDLIEKDLAFLSTTQAVEGRKFLVTPRLVQLDHDGKRDNGVIVAQDGSRVVYFDDFNDEFALGNLSEWGVEQIGSYGDFRYAIQALMNDEKSII